jgi:hypothetical protein
VFSHPLLRTRVVLDSGRCLGLLHAPVDLGGDQRAVSARAVSSDQVRLDVHVFDWESVCL